MILRYLAASRMPESSSTPLLSSVRVPKRPMSRGRAVYLSKAAATPPTSVASAGVSSHAAPDPTSRARLGKAQRPWALRAREQLTRTVRSLPHDDAGRAGQDRRVER